MNNSIYSSDSSADVLAVISPVPPSTAPPLTVTIDDTLLNHLTQPGFGNKKQKQDMILGILREPSAQNFTGEALTVANESFFIHKKQSDTSLRRQLHAKDCAEYLILLKPLLQGSGTNSCWLFCSSEGELLFSHADWITTTTSLSRMGRNSSWSL